MGGNKEIIESEQPTNSTHVAEANKENGGTENDGSLGKFKDVESLLKSYNCLQAEFTKRNSRLKELEGENARLKEQAERTSLLAFSGNAEDNSAVAENVASVKNTGTDNVPADDFGDGGLPVVDDLYNKAVNNSQVAERIVRDYLTGVLSSKTKVPLIKDVYGGSALIPPKRPSTFSEAGKMAEQILRKKN